MRSLAVAAACVGLFTLLAKTGMSADCGAPAVMSDGWAVSSPAQQGLDPQLICSIGSGLAKLTEADPHGVAVIRQGLLVYEQYFTGEDMRGWTPFGVVAHDANTSHNTESITKGIIALLVGIAWTAVGSISTRQYSRSCPNTLIFAPRTKTGSQCVICCR